MKQWTELQIIEGLKSGDERVMGPIFKLWHKPLCYFANTLLKNTLEAEDIVAMSFVKLWDRRNDFQSILKIRNFLYIVTRHSCYDYKKMVRRRKPLEEDFLLLQDETDAEFQAQQMKSEIISELAEAVKKIPPVRKEIFRLIYVEGISTVEICDILKIKEGTVLCQHKRILDTLRKAMGVPNPGKGWRPGKYRRTPILT